MKNKKFISKIASSLSLSIISHINTYGDSLQKVFIHIVGIVGGIATATKIYRSFRYHELLPSVNKEILNSEFQIHFVDVGAGDCALIKYKDKSWLIDVGYSIAASTDIKNYLPDIDVKKLSGVILTHTHTDHYWKLKDILNDKILNPDKFYYSYLDPPVTLKQKYDAIEYKSRVEDPINKFKKSKGNHNCIQVKPEYIIFESDDKKFKIKVIGPVSHHEHINNNSVVLLVEYQGKKILMMGDAEESSEKEIMEYAKQQNIDISNVDLVKIGHHGSDTSSSPEFVKLTNPKTIVCSTGKHDLTLGLYNLHEYRSIIHRWIDGNNRNKDEKCNVLTTEEQTNIIAYYDNNDKKLKYARKEKI